MATLDDCRRWTIELCCALRGWDVATVRATDTTHGTRRSLTIKVNDDPSIFEQWEFAPTSPSGKLITPACASQQTLTAVSTARCAPRLQHERGCGREQIRT